MPLILTTAPPVELPAPPPPPPPIVLPEIGSASATYYAPDGSVWPLTDRGRGWYTLADGVSGLGAAPREFTVDPYPRGGARVRHVQPQPRTIVWPLRVTGSTHMEFVERWRALARAFARTSTDGPGVLDIARPDGSRRCIAVHYQDGFEGLGTAQSGRIWDVAAISLYCEDPYWYDPVPVTVHRETGSGVDFLDPFPSVSSSQILGATEVENPGDVEAWPQVVITGPASLVTFSRQDTGEAFTLDPAAVAGALAAGDQVVIATDPPQVRKRTAEVQTVSLGAATAGSVTLNLFGQVTGSIPYNATAADVRTALEALADVEPGDVVATGGPWPATITLTFLGQYLGGNVNLLVVTPTGLTGGTVTVTTPTQGATANWVGALDWPTAVLWGLTPGDNLVTFQLDGSGAGSAVDLTFYPRYETA